MKTYKREVAIAMLLFLGGVFVAGLYLERADVVEAAEFLTLPIFTFAAAAFGLDAYAKQIK